MDAWPTTSTRTPAFRICAATPLAYSARLSFTVNNRTCRRHVQAGSSPITQWGTGAVEEAGQRGTEIAGQPGKTGRPYGSGEACTMEAGGEACAVPYTAPLAPLAPPHTCTGASHSGNAPM